MKVHLRELIEILLHDSRPMIRSTAAWAIGKIAGQKAKEVLQTHMKMKQRQKLRWKLIKRYKLINVIIFTHSFHIF